MRFVEDASGEYLWNHFVSVKPGNFVNSAEMQIDQTEIARRRRFGRAEYRTQTD